MSDVDPLGNRPEDYASSHVTPAMLRKPSRTETGCKTWNDEVREVAAELGHTFPITDTFVDWLLWNRTAWPMASAGHVRAQLVLYFTDPAAADALAESES